MTRRASNVMLEVLFHLIILLVFITEVGLEFS